jgi:chromosome segregation and condensation protein ScpB
MTEQQMPTISDIGEAIEAILFAAGYPVKYEKLAEVLGLSESDVRLFCEHMAEEYQKAGRGILMLCVPEN